MAPARADLPYEARVWWQRVYLDSQYSASSFFSYHCHRRCQAKVAVAAVVWGFPSHHWNGKRHCHSLTIYPAFETGCTRFAHNVRRPLLVLVIQFTPKVQMVIGFLDQRRYRAPLWRQHHFPTYITESVRTVHTRTRHPVLHLRFNGLKLRHCLTADAMTLSCDITLVTALVTRDCHLWLKPYFEIGTHCTWKQPPVSSKQELNNNS